MQVLDMEALARALGGQPGENEAAQLIKEAKAKASAKLVAAMKFEEQETDDLKARRLLDMFAEFSQGKERFKVGMLVQQRLWTIYSSPRVGIVVSLTGIHPKTPMRKQVGSPCYGLREDMHVAHIRGGEFSIYAVHSGFYEPYTGAIEPA